MNTLFVCLAALCFSFHALGADQLTVHKVQIAGPSGSINGKVIGFGDHLIFVDDDSPEKSFMIPRGEIRTARNTAETVFVEMSRPVTDRFGTRSNVEIRFIDPAAAGVVTKWIGVPVERGRTVVTYSLDVRHDHRGQGGCNGKVTADDNRLRFESVTEAGHSRTWDYNTLSRFETEKGNALLKVTTKGGETYHFNIINGATAGEMHRLVSDKIVAAR